MKRTLTALALLAGLASQSSFADFGTLSPSALTWTGTYKDTQGGLMVVLEQPGKIDISGTDRGSIYRVVCMRESADANAANCTGDGINFEQADQPKRFTYRSQLRRSSEGNFSEVWDVIFDTGSLTGKAEFKRVSGTTR